MLLCNVHMVAVVIIQLHLNYPLLTILHQPALNSSFHNWTEDQMRISLTEKNLIRVDFSKMESVKGPIVCLSALIFN